MKKYWINGNETGKDIYAAFRYEFDVEEETEAELRTHGLSWFNAWLDGHYVTEGPYRFAECEPEYGVKKIRLSAGKHVLAVQVHHIGEETRIVKNTQPFFAAEIVAGGREIPVRIKCMRLEAYKNCVRRVNVELGWAEYCDLGQIPAGWKEIGFDGKGFSDPVPVCTDLPAETPVQVGSVKNLIRTFEPVQRGTVSEFYGYEADDIPVRFYLRRLDSDEFPAQGIYLRFDLGRVCLSKALVDLVCTAPVKVEIAYAEYLTDGRVAPFITLSGSLTCNLDKYDCPAGKVEIRPLTPKGGRFCEIHIVGDEGTFEVSSVAFAERSYFAEPEGSFESGDDLLNRIWTAGINTLRSCSEDAIIDNPTRERGEWLGDAVSAATDITNVGYADFGLVKRALRHAALGASTADPVKGMVAGLAPSQLLYPSTYAMQWFGACWNVYTMSGDGKLLVDLESFADANYEAFRNLWTDEGLSREVGWTFVDWGYISNEGFSDMAANLGFLSAVRVFRKWKKFLGRDVSELDRMETEIEKVVGRWLEGRPFSEIGMHRGVLALGEGFFEGERRSECVEFIKKHYLRCFPNDPTAPRLSAPDKDNDRLITPYYSHYVFPILIANGEMRFVMDQIRTCWGWLLENGDTTLCEVFDRRWSHCHEWSGCPTWILSRFALGLKPRFELGDKTYEFVFDTCGLDRCKGTLPIFGGGSIDVEWNFQDGSIAYSLTTSQPIRILRNGEITEVSSTLSLTL